MLPLFKYIPLVIRVFHIFHGRATEGRGGVITFLDTTGQGRRLVYKSPILANVLSEWPLSNGNIE